MTFITFGTFETFIDFNTFNLIISTRQFMNAPGDLKHHFLPLEYLMLSTVKCL